MIGSGSFVKMEGLHILLLDGLQRHESHLRPLHGFADRLRVIPVILVAPAEGLDELRADDADRVALVLKLPGPMKGTGASLDADDGRGQLRHKGEELRPAQALREDRAPLAVDAVELEDVLREVNADHRQCHRPLLV